jgi:hypothetical protein
MTVSIWSSRVCAVATTASSSRATLNRNSHRAARHASSVRGTAVARPRCSARLARHERRGARRGRAGAVVERRDRGDDVAMCLRHGVQQHQRVAPAGHREHEPRRRLESLYRLVHGQPRVGHSV